jgi:hypothetical protein
MSTTRLGRAHNRWRCGFAGLIREQATERISGMSNVLLLGSLALSPGVLLPLPLWSATGDVDVRTVMRRNYDKYLP